MMRLDPQCAKRITEWMRDCGLTEDEAWQLYEDEPKSQTVSEAKKEYGSDEKDEEMCFAKDLSMVEAATMEEQRQGSASSRSALKRSRTPPHHPSSNPFNGELDEDEALEVAKLKSMTPK